MLRTCGALRRYVLRVPRWARASRNTEAAVISRHAAIVYSHALYFMTLASSGDDMRAERDEMALADRCHFSLPCKFLFQKRKLALF